MMEEEISEKFTGQGLGSPEPVRKVSERVGSHGPSAGDRSAPTVESQAVVLDNATGLSEAGKGIQNPFQKSRKIGRSPIRARSHSLVDNNKTTQQQSAVLMSVSQRKGIPSLDDDDNGGVSFSTRNEESAMIKSLESQLNAARNEIKELRQIIASLQPKKSYSPINSDEEEELVAKETAWLLPKHKKRKLTVSPEKKGTSPKPKPNPGVVKKHRPPPVILSNIEDYTEINQVLQTKKLNFKANLMNNKQLKINVDTEQEYRDLTKVMNNAKLEWHTYENKQTRPIRVMARNLHPSCKPEDIKNELINRGFKILDVANKIKKSTVNGREIITPLPLFMLTFQNSEDIKKIYDIQYLCQLRVKIEALRNNKLIPQCKRCQRYGHTQRFCRREANCVKCAGCHLTAECSKLKNIAPRCFNCGEAHPANYRGCLVAKELQKRRNNLTKSKKAQSTQPRTFSSKKVTNEVSYAQIAQASNTQPVPQQNEQQFMMQMMQNMINIMNKISERLDRLEAKNTGATVRRPS